MKKIGILIVTIVISYNSFAQIKQHNSLSFLHTSGQDIVNEAGHSIFLKGVGLGNWLLPEGYMWKFGSMGDRPRKIEKVVADLIGKGCSLLENVPIKLHYGGRYKTNCSTGF